MEHLWYVYICLSPMMLIENVKVGTSFEFMSRATLHILQYHAMLNVRKGHVSNASPFSVGKT